MSEDADDSDSDDEEPPKLPDGSNSDSDSDEEPESDKASSRVKEEVIVEDVDDNDYDDPPEAQASEPIDIPRPPEELGVLNLCYRSNRYKLKDGVISVNLDSHAP